MKLAILATGPRLYDTRQLLRAARARGHQVTVLDPQRCSFDLRAETPQLLYGGRPVVGFDAVVPRLGASVHELGVTVVRHFELAGVYSPVGAEALASAHDTWRALQVLAGHGVSVPHSTLVHDRRDAPAAIERVGGPPVILEMLDGSRGTGLMLADSSAVAEAMIETLLSTRRRVLVQAFDAEHAASDLRAWVVGRRVAAAVRRGGHGRGAYAELPEGDRVEVVELDERAAKTAVRAAEVLGARVAAIDLLDGPDGPRVLRVDTAPGLEEVETAGRLDLARQIIDEIAARAAFPGLDVHRRLTPDSGYGIAEIPVREGAGFAGRTLHASRLRDRDLEILALYRGRRTISKPAGDLVLEAGDRLLCFGRLDSMRRLASSDRTRRRGVRTTGWP